MTRARDRQRNAMVNGPVPWVDSVLDRNGSRTDSGVSSQTGGNRGIGGRRRRLLLSVAGVRLPATNRRRRAGRAFSTCYQLERSILLSRTSQTRRPHTCHRLARRTGGLTWRCSMRTRQNKVKAKAGKARRAMRGVQGENGGNTNRTGTGVGGGSAFSCDLRQLEILGQLIGRQECERFTGVDLAAYITEVGGAEDRAALLRVVLPQAIELFERTWAG